MPLPKIFHCIFTFHGEDSRLFLLQESPEDFPRRRFGNGVDEFDAASQPRMRRHSGVDELLQLLRRRLDAGLRDDEGLGKLAGVVRRRNSDDGDVGDRFVRQQQRLQLRGSYLMTF